MCFADIFSSVTCFHFLNSVFCRAEVFNFKIKRRKGTKNLYWEFSVYNCKHHTHKPRISNQNQFSSVQFSLSVVSDSWRPHHSMLGLPVNHKFPEFTQTHAHWASDAIQPSHPLSTPSPPAPNPSQHQGHFQWVNSSHQVAKVLEFQLQHQSFQWTPRTDLLKDGLVGSPCSPRDSQEFLQHHSSKASISQC